MPEKSILLCVNATDPLKLEDNITSPCTKCGQLLQMRPHWDLTVIDPCCLLCMDETIKAMPPDEKVTFVATPRTMAEVLAESAEGTKH